MFYSISTSARGSVSTHIQHAAPPQGVVCRLNLSDPDWAIVHFLCCQLNDHDDLES
jgi:hypothetical protein